MTEIQSTNAMLTSFWNYEMVVFFANSVMFQNMTIFSMIVTDHSDCDFTVLRPSLLITTLKCLHVCLLMFYSPFLARFKVWLADQLIFWPVNLFINRPRITDQPFGGPMDFEILECNSRSRHWFWWHTNKPTLFPFQPKKSQPNEVIKMRRNKRFRRNPPPVSTTEPVTCNFNVCRVIYRWYHCASFEFMIRFTLRASKSCPHFFSCNT